MIRSLETYYIKNQFEWGTHFFDTLRNEDEEIGEFRFEVRFGFPWNVVGVIAGLPRVNDWWVLGHESILHSHVLHWIHLHVHVFGDNNIHFFGDKRLFFVGLDKVESKEGLGYLQ